MTKLLNTQICQLTAIIVGGEPKRAATAEAAIKRFRKVTVERGIMNADQILAMDWADAVRVCEVYAPTEAETNGGETTAPVEPVAAPQPAERPSTTLSNEDRYTLADKRAVAEALVAPYTVEDAMRDFHARDDGSDAFMRQLFQRVFDAGVASTTKPRRERKATERKPRAEGPSKKDQAAALLLRPEGCTGKDILEMTGWPSVSVPAIARAAKITLRQEKEGRSVRYFGTAA